MKIDLPVDKHKSVGPMADMYGHGPVTVVQDPEVGDTTTDEGTTVFICLDCGYTAHDNRMLAHEECDREKNGITQTWREYLDTEDGDFPTAADDEGWPIED